MNRDFARLDLTGLEVDALRRVGTVGLGRAYGAQDIGMFVAGGVYVDLLGEVEPPDDADVLGDLVIHGCELSVAGSAQQGLVEGFVRFGQAAGARTGANARLSEVWASVSRWSEINGTAWPWLRASVSKVRILSPDLLSCLSSIQPLFEGLALALALCP